MNDFFTKVEPKAGAKSADLKRVETYRDELVNLITGDTPEGLKQHQWQILKDRFLIEIKNVTLWLKIQNN
ncbi:MAG: hypothetical protein V4608_10780 [Bacteroidota bacterium]